VKNHRQHLLILVVGIALGAALTINLSGPGPIVHGQDTAKKSVEAGSRAWLTDPVGTVGNRYSYHPGTEALGKDEIRIVACGTGMPAARRGQAAACFLVELGNGYKIVYAGDTAPNKWFIEHCRDSDLIINECMLTPEQLMEFYGQPAPRAMMMQAEIHTSAQAFGKIMSMLKPRHAVAYHFFNEEGTRYTIYDAIRQTYGGPLSMADDMMVWNITRDGIRERMAVSDTNAWDVAGPTEPPLPDGKFPPQESKFITEGRWDVSDVENEAFREFRKKHGLPQPK